MNRKILIRDDDCHWYLIDEQDKQDFLKWVAYSNEMKFDGINSLKDFNKFAINSYANVKIIDCVIE